MSHPPMIFPLIPLLYKIGPSQRFNTKAQILDCFALLANFAPEIPLEWSFGPCDC